MSSAINALDDLDRRRQELESNVLKLQKSLYHWRFWEAEYDGLKEEIETLDDDSPREDFLQIARDFGGTLVNEEEVQVLLGEKQGVSRTRQQVVGIISRRIDYVRQNVFTIEKRLRAAEEELSVFNEGSVLGDTAREQNKSVTAVASTSGDGAGSKKDFPMTDIFEQLDEEGNLVSGSTTTPGAQAPELLEMLKKVGVGDIPDAPRKEQTGIAERPKTEDKITDVTDEPDATAKGIEYTTEPKKSTQLSKAENKAGQIPRNTEGRQKSDFAPDLGETTTRSEPPASTSKDINGVSGEHLHDHASIAAEQFTDNQEEQPVTEIDEPLEDAELRREMLQYGINEIGAVVAELELDDDASDVSIGDGESGGYNSEDCEEEDEFGRNTNPALSEEYHQKMRELEKSLNARGLWNVGKDTHSLPVDVKSELEKPHVTEDNELVGDKITDNSASKKKPKKNVAFAESLDIAPSPQPPKPASSEKKLPPKQPEVPAVSDSIVERTEHAGDTGYTQPTPPKKASRFKNTRNGPLPRNDADDNTIPTTAPKPPRPSLFRSSVRKNEPSSSSHLPLFSARPKEPKPFSQPIPDITDRTPPQSVPQPPEGKTLADNLFEREVSEGTAAAPEPDELDEQLHRKEIASEFYRMRNRIAQQNSSSVDDKEPETIPIGTDEPPKRVSKFKAARLR